MRMRSKSLQLGNLSADSAKPNRIFDFVNLYKTTATAQSSASFSENVSSKDGYNKSSQKVKSASERTFNKLKKNEKREPIVTSRITIDSPSLNNSDVGNTSLNESKVTSTPLVNRKTSTNSTKVKSIIKNLSSLTNDTMDESNTDSFSSNPKKRNKSVRFMLGGNEEVASKKSKSDESTESSKTNTTSKVKGLLTKRQFKKNKKDRVGEKENKINQLSVNSDSVLESSSSVKTSKNLKMKSETTLSNQIDQTENVIQIKKKNKKSKKFKTPDQNTEIQENSITTESTSQEGPDKIKKSRKKKHQDKEPTGTDTEEPVSKSAKKDLGPDVVAELENLSIGDNAHTLTNLLDEMTVADKDKRKKLKRKSNKNKKPQVVTENEETEKTDDAEVQEKVKWMRRKWNKENKDDVKEASLDTTVIVENLPLSLLLSYKKVLAEHFVKYGLIRSVGIAEVYPTEVSKPVFTTTINFYSDGAATQALEDDAVFDGSRIRLKQPLPPTETTLVVRSYAPLTVQCVSTLFIGAGRIRSIRNTVKGKHSMASFFVEFDGPESVESAMRLAKDAKIAGKKVHVSKFEHRPKKEKINSNSEAENTDSKEQQK